MGEGLKRAFAAARATQKCSVRACKRVRQRHDHLCQDHRIAFDIAVRKLLGKSAAPKAEKDE